MAITDTLAIPDAPTLRRTALVWDDIRILLAAHDLTVTYRQLDYWSRVGIVRPEDRIRDDSGYVREWSMTEVAILAAILRLMAIGMSLRDAARYAREGEPDRRLTVRFGSGLRLEAGPSVWRI